MHRHGYKGRKFGRETSERRALVRGLMRSLAISHSVTTTLARAKEMRRGMEKLITIAKKGGLTNRRLIIGRLDSTEAGGHLMDVVAPQIKRDSGYLRIERVGARRGDNSEMAMISFVDEIKMENKAKKTDEKVSEKEDKK